MMAAMAHVTAAQRSTNPGSTGLLRAARLELGWSQSRAADALISMAAARGVPVAAAASLKTQLSRWENGHALPEGQYRELLAELYQRPVEQLGLSPSEPADGGPAEQRRLLADRLASAAEIDEETLGLLREQLDTTRRLDDRLGALATGGAVRGQLTDLELALAHCLHPERRKAVAALLAGTALLAGAQGLDLGAVADAWRDYATAAGAAREAEAPELVGQVLGGQAEVLAEIGRPDDGVHTAERALTATGSDARPSVRVALLAGLGRALAETGDAAGSRHAFDLAERLDADPGVEVDVAALHRSRGHALSVLGEPDAVPELERGLRPGTAVPIRDRAAAHVDLVVALHAAGRSGQAAEHAGVARELTGRIGSERLRGRLDRALAGPGP